VRRSNGLTVVKRDQFLTVLARLCVGVTASVLAACSPFAEGRTESSKPTIVSLNPCLDAVLVEIADPEQVLALSHYSHDPGASSISLERAKRFGITGGTAEEVIALDPDMVVASRFIAPSARSAFERLGIRVETFDSPTSVEASLEQIRALAAATSNGAQGEELVGAIERSLSTPSEHDPISTLLWQQGQIVPGEVTLISELLTRHGFVNHGVERGLKQADYVSLERLLAEPPELVLLAGDSAGQQHPVLSQLSQTQVDSLDPRLFYCGGPSILAVQARLQEIRETLR